MPEPAYGDADIITLGHFPRDSSEIAARRSSIRGSVQRVKAEAGNSAAFAPSARPIRA
jgi:hypothetical protein